MGFDGGLIETWHNCIVDFVFVLFASISLIPELDELTAKENDASGNIQKKLVKKS